jgi:acyl carrier protein
MEKFIDLIKETLEMEAQEVKSKDKFRDYEEWDSLAVLSVLAMINEEYDIIIPRKEFEKLITIEDIINFINE